MKYLLLVMLSLFVVSCASHGPEREVASEDEQGQVKKQSKHHERSWENKR